MGRREEAICITGVYRGVREEMRCMQEQWPEHIMFLQPHAAARSVRLADNPPSVKERVRLFLSTTEERPTVRSTAAIVGWDQKTTRPETRANAVSRLLWTAAAARRWTLPHGRRREDAEHRRAPRRADDCASPALLGD